MQEEQIRHHEVNFEERRKFEIQVQIFQMKNEENFKFFQNEKWRKHDEERKNKKQKQKMKKAKKQIKKWRFVHWKT